MNTILWVVQALLAAVFLFASGMKFFAKTRDQDPASLPYQDQCCSLSA